MSLAVATFIGWSHYQAADQLIRPRHDALQRVEDSRHGAKMRASQRPAAFEEMSAPTVLPALPVTTDDARLLAEHATLRHLADGSGLQLSPEQWSAFADVTSHYQAVRYAYEAAIATVVLAQRGHYRLEVPPYANAGDRLRNDFLADLRDSLGTATAERVVSTLGSSLESHFAGFGVSAQTLDFIADATGHEADYLVTRTATFLQTGAAGERLVTRREAFFPGIEDRDGHQWGPFLSLLAASVVTGARS